MIVAVVGAEREGVMIVAVVGDAMTVAGAEGVISVTPADDVARTIAARRG